MPSREQTLRTLHTAATSIRECESVESACECTVEAAEEALDFEMCNAMVHDGDRWLEPVALSSGAPDDGSRRMADDQGLAGKTYRTGESHVVDRIRPDDETDPAKELYRSAMSVPIGESGVFQAVSTEREAFDATDVEFTELLVAHTAGTIDRVRFEETLRRQNERLEKFVDVVSHDLRNPLNVATGQLELAARECDSDHLDGVEQAHDRMSALIDKLLTVARSGRPVDSLERVNLGALADDCWQNVATAGAVLDVEAEHIIEADVDRLKRLVENLFRNAVEHGLDVAPTRGSASERPAAGTRDDPSLTVTVGDLPDGFCVADDGPGIPEAQREDVFDAGYTTTDDGTGLGLNIVAEIAEAHGWTVSVTESEAGGARFEFTGVGGD